MGALASQEEQSPRTIVVFTSGMGEFVSPKVMVLTGGRSAERDVSLVTGIAVSQGLHEAGVDVLVFDPASSQPPIAWHPETDITTIESQPPELNALTANGAGLGVAMTTADLARAALDHVDLVFIALHGGDGENGRLQALLDTAGVRYTGSRMNASALAMDKHASKRIFIAEDVPTPRWRITDAEEDVSFEDASSDLGLPLIVKPNAQGSTVGLTLVREEAQWIAALKGGFRWDDRLLIEEFIAGREITVSILGDRALPVVEILPTHELYDYECKYTSGRSQYVCPAELNPRMTDRVQTMGLRAFRALGCRGYARVDFRLGNGGQFYCLEVNTLPGMTSTSLVPKAAHAAGIEFPELLQRICQLAMANSKA